MPIEFSVQNFFIVVNELFYLTSLKSIWRRISYNISMIQQWRRCGLVISLNDWRCDLKLDEIRHLNTIHIELCHSGHLITSSRLNRWMCSDVYKEKCNYKPKTKKKKHVKSERCVCSTHFFVVRTDSINWNTDLHSLKRKTVNKKKTNQTDKQNTVRAAGHLNEWHFGIIYRHVQICHTQKIWWFRFQRV